ncbi:hypothetical protein XELAEV_18040351mg [Xenopus laevis]|nr:hypothetical protein XELAEV_18040351mg [Xenopus laevis]
MGPSTIFLVSLFSLLIPAQSAPDPTLDSNWQLWVKTHQKTYKDAEEERTRRIIWEETLKLITVHNLEYSLGLHTYEIGMNHLGDMTYEEITDTMTGFQASDDPEPNITYVPQEKVTPPEQIDWRDKGCVTPVMAQGGCNSCYAFSALGAMEGQWQKWSNKLEALSEQNLVDCSKVNGCSPGSLDDTFKYIKENGVNTNHSYPYKGKEQTCNFNSSNTVARCKGYIKISPGSEEQLKQIVGTIGPVSVAINFTKTFRSFTTGVYTDNKCETLLGLQNHAVLVVGYGKENDEDYWLVKNSYGTGFGVGGYIKMRRNYRNHCGIANYIYYPIFS